jgi:putative acetyltransferase
VADPPRLTVRVTDDRLDSAAAAPLVRDLLAELEHRYGQPDPDPDHLQASHLAPPHGAFVVAWQAEQPVGCGGLRRADEGVGELKRMFVVPAARRRGVGWAVLVALEARAGVLGYRQLILETGVHQPEAMGLYASAGYAPIEPYGFYRGSPTSRCFAKEL